MAKTSNQRKFPRFPINFVLFPVLISAPGLTDLTLDPHDISMGGFKKLSQNLIQHGEGAGEMDEGQVEGPPPQGFVGHPISG